MYKRLLKENKKAFKVHFLTGQENFTKELNLCL